MKINQNLYLSLFLNRFTDGVTPTAVSQNPTRIFLIYPYLIIIYTNNNLTISVLLGND